MGLAEALFDVDPVMLAFAVIVGPLTLTTAPLSSTARPCSSSTSAMSRALRLPLFDDSCSATTSEAVRSPPEAAAEEDVGAGAVGAAGAAALRVAASARACAVAAAASGAAGAAEKREARLRCSGAGAGSSRGRLDMVGWCGRRCPDLSSGPGV